jgi:hypothetical protein
MTPAMIPNHKQFVEAIKDKKKVCLRFYSKADSGVIDLICAPVDYGPGEGIQDGVNRYWLWDYTSNTGSPNLGLLPDQILDIRVLGQAFDPAEFGAPPPTWSIPRAWGPTSASRSAIPLAGPLRVEKQPVSFESPRPSDN